MISSSAYNDRTWRHKKEKFFVDLDQETNLDDGPAAMEIDSDASDLATLGLFNNNSRKRQREEDDEYLPPAKRT